jgi:hypothetical protein
MISNQNFINYKVLDLVELYDFDINFVFIQLHLKRYEFISATVILRVDLVNRPWKSIFRDGGLNKTISNNHSFSETVDISNHPWK